MITNEFNYAVHNIRELKYNPYIVNNVKKTNKNNILKAEKQQIPILTIYKDGLLLNYRIGNYKIAKSLVNNLYSLNSIISIYVNNTHKSIRKFLASQRFNYILHYMDNSFKIPQYIYFIKFKDGVKIGRTFDIKQRYNPSEVFNIVLRVVNVENINKCEKELKDKFKNKYNLVKGLEKFDINTSDNNEILNALRTFDDVVSKYKTKNKAIKNNHLQYVRDGTDELGNGYYVSSLVASIIYNIFGDINYSDIKYVLNLIDKASDKFDKTNYYSTFIESGDRFFYWSYHGYKIIANGSKGLINASRLWNTVKKENHISDKYKNKSLANFLKSAFIRNIFKEHTEIKPVSYKYKDRPLLNGKYLPIYFTHFIIQYLNAKYAVEIAKYLTESLFEEQNKRSIKEAQDRNIIVGGNIENSNDSNYITNNEVDSNNINNTITNNTITNNIDDVYDEYKDNEPISEGIINSLVNEFKKIPYYEEYNKEDNKNNNIDIVDDEDDTDEENDNYITNEESNNEDN